MVEQLALARRESPARAAQLLTLARSLAEDLPRTGAALARGEISEFRAQVVARETAHLSPTLREVVDRDLAESEGGIGQWGNRQLAAETQRRAYRLDPEGLVRRRSKAVMDRRVWIRPAPDTMAQVSALLDVKDGVRAYATPRRDAQSRKAAGDARSVDQLMADLLVARLTGDDDGATGSVAVHLVMTDQALLGAEGTPGRQEPADLPGVGVVPAEVARRLVRDADRVWLRRLFVNPTTGGVVAADSRRRVFDGILREVLVTLDHTCRTPWCDAPVRHVDHVRPVATGGATSFANAQGLCERCNYAKESGGLVSGPSPGRTGEVVVVTRTGHTYRSRRRPPPGAPPLGVASEVEIWLRSRALTWAGPRAVSSPAPAAGRRRRRPSPRRS